MSLIFRVLKNGGTGSYCLEVNHHAALNNLLFGGFT
jgi:hypothetical protein